MVQRAQEVCPGGAQLGLGHARSDTTQLALHAGIGISCIAKVADGRKPPRQLKLAVCRQQACEAVGWRELGGRRKQKQAAADRLSGGGVN